MTITTKKSANYNRKMVNTTLRLASIVDRGAVRLGGQGPVFRPSVADAGKVRIGGQGPLFRSAVADAGKVRLGGQGPLFR